ncbi:glycosyltransferase [Pararoseomonas indoligenes]|uniref:Glycosyltransferase family 1 protein n=1 Tax=Roseomonas indoligenes TaxID=2820811 RepID=A0A940MSP0_9PROT|nr:glycosyltransferase [Pararoseomonas indoligenes]MBP0491166.1 glycosyltransferase family 1 protein [Pararoseomonas indoligenes]
MLRTGTAPRVLIATFGSRGDIRPHVLLARTLMARGHEVTLLTNEEFQNYCRNLGVEPVLISTPFGRHLGARPAGSPRPSLSGFLRDANAFVTDAFRQCHGLIRGADLVVYNASAFFCAELAREQGKPAIHVALQPLLPSCRAPLSLLSGAGCGSLSTRLSHQAMRALPLLLRSGIREGRRRTGAGARLRPWTNPLTTGLHYADQVLAFSESLVADPGDWPGRKTQTGFWFDKAPPAPLSAEVRQFLGAGPPPVYVGFGSMVWRSRKNARLVIEALRLFEGRVVLGPAIARTEDDLPPNVLRLGFHDHAALFPHMAAAIHHGGAGTTAEGLRHGLPTAVFPVIGDQGFWGAQVARLGAGPPPVPLRRVTPAILADTLHRVSATPAYEKAAAGLATRLAAEPGLERAVDLIETRLTEAAAQESIHLAPGLQVRAGRLGHGTGGLLLPPAAARNLARLRNPFRKQPVPEGALEAGRA